MKNFESWLGYFYCLYIETYILYNIILCKIDILNITKQICQKLFSHSFFFGGGWGNIVQSRDNAPALMHTSLVTVESAVYDFANTLIEVFDERSLTPP